MKKKNLKSLLLNKKAISSLNGDTIKGGAIDISEVIGCVSGGNDPHQITDNCKATTSCTSDSPMTCFNSCILCW